MKKSFLHILLLIPAIAVFLLILPLTSCSGEETVYQNTNNEETIAVSAKIARQLSTRSYQEEGKVEKGKYFLTYPPTTNDEYAVGTVGFDQKEPNRIGIVTTSDGHELSWNLVKNVPNPTFYLDNVSPELNNVSPNSVPTTITFSEDNNPFIAAEFDSIDGKNDLLWGEYQSRRGEKNLHFDLHHNMARVRVEITTEANSYNEKFDLTDAIVKLSSIVQTPISYNRLNGLLSLPSDEDEGKYSDLVLVDKNIGWNKAPTPEEIEKKSSNTYFTQNFVLPPQSLRDGEDRPKLIIEIGDETYSGYLPHAMEIIDASGENKPYPANLAFLKEHILTIKTKITPDPPELILMPVEVVEWIDKGNFKLEGRQAGVYSAEDFYNLMNLYGGENYNELDLLKYGYKKNGETKEQWVFNFFASVTLYEDQIKGKMQVSEGKEDYSFDFYGYDVRTKATESSSPKKITEIELYQLVSGAQP